MAAAQLQELLGIPAEEAEQLTKVASEIVGSTDPALLVECGMNMYFEMQSGTGGPIASAATNFKVPFDWYTFVWPAAEPIPESWLKQDLSFCSNEGARVGLVQPKNGPCGLLSLIQATLICELYKSYGKVDLNRTPSDKDLANSLATLLLTARGDPKKPVVLCNWKGDPGLDIVTREVSPKHVHDAVASGLESFKRPSGLVLFLYSGILTRGLETAKQEITQQGGEPPLVLAPFFICTTDVFGLFMRGKVGMNVGAYTAAGKKCTAFGEFPFGLLSTTEKESGIPVADALKFPKYPVWILHGGDHFTVLFRETPDPITTPNFELLHWNGLPPGGPALRSLKITAPKGDAKPAPETHKATFIKPLPGEIDDIVQARPADKEARPGEYKTWTYEVVLAIDDPDVQGGTRDPNEPPEPIFDQGAEQPGPWRCAHCYRNRYSTMFFGVNDDTPTCSKCGKTRHEAGWSLWLPYEKLGPRMQRAAMKMFAPKVVLVLSTRWPMCTVEYGSGRPPSL